MDGNGRWAQQRHRPRIIGHRAGARAVNRCVEFCLERGIGALTLFAFSSENWNRPDLVSTITGFTPLPPTSKAADAKAGHALRKG